MVGCVVHGCSHKRRQGEAAVTLHSFPKDKDVIRRWLLATGQQYDNFDNEVDKIFGSKSNSYRMCSRHFTPDCYMTNVVTGKKRLIPIAVPSVFPPYPAVAETMEDVRMFSTKIQCRWNYTTPSCVMCRCTSSWKKRDPSIILHVFPKEPERIKLWLQQTDLNHSDIEKMVEDLSSKKVYDIYRMCSLHFTHESYNYDGNRRILKKHAVPTIFKRKRPSAVSSKSSVSTNISLVSTPASSPSEQHITATLPTDGQKPYCAGTVQKHQDGFRVIQPKTSSQPTIQQITLVPLVPQRVFLQTGTVSQNSNAVVVDRSTTIQPTVTTFSEATQKHAVLPGVSQQSSVLRPPSSSILKVPVSSSSCVKQTTSTISEFTASSHGEHQEPLTPAYLQQSTSSPVKFLQKLDSSLSSASSPTISTSVIDKSSYKTMTTPPSSIALSIVHKAKPYSRVAFPVAGNLSSVTQMPPSTSSSAQKPPPMSVVHIPLKTPTSQTTIPDCLPPSKKRKLEEIVFLEHSAACPSGSSVSHSCCMSQTSVNAGKLYLLSNSTPLVQPSCLIHKPLMVDKGVNTDFVTNRKSCCVATTHTEAKVCMKHCKMMCNFPSKETYHSESVISAVSPEDNTFSDCIPSRSDSENDPCVELINLDLVKIEILPDSIVDASIPTASVIKQEYHIKEENDSSAGQVDIPPSPFKGIFTVPEPLKIEPSVKTEDDEVPISTSSQDTTHFVLQNPKNERTSPIPCELLTPVYRNPKSWETSSIQTDDKADHPNDSSFHINELSEDEDESFLVSSDAEDEDDIKHAFQDLDSPVENIVEEEKYIVFESCLKKLIMMIPCRSETKCMSLLTQYRKETVGSYLSVEARCSSGHTSLLWESQPRHGYEPLGNVLLSAAVLFSGSSFVKSQHMFKLINLKSIDKTTYSRNQSMYLFPAISHHWKEEQKAVIQSVQEMPLCLAGDQQLDNPGFSANYSTYSLMDVASKKICSFSVEPVTPRVTLEGLEKIGFQKSMGELQTMNADVKIIVTDRSIAIQDILKDRYPGILHKIDLWHLSRSIGNEVLMAAKHKGCEILYQWVEAIRNHLWWSFSTCCKNPDLLIQKWKSVIYHVANVHEWDGDSDCRACHHPPLPEEVVNNTNWLKKGSAAHEQLKNIVENTSLLKDLKQLSFLCHLGELEIYRRICLKYNPKSLHFFMDSMVARAQLAALDYNRNVYTVKAMVKDALNGEALGSMTQRFKVPKGQKSWIVKAMYKPSCQNFLFNIMSDVIALVKEEKTFW
ncbi:uncharacterized protein LOC130276953 [Hyla sarda]|uniref:uncharacterized protein LOC130276953 n=1 Tax=Hyla sarda TaxID=327740 RepID=UPI0024C235AF|nr:uncharacterized protein LOC130276953 [Hyla sarda]XP_056383002.1 uncharacterized protein LOC130276953 [Hyla sarda]